MNFAQAADGDKPHPYNGLTGKQTCPNSDRRLAIQQVRMETCARQDIVSIHKDPV